MDARQVPHAEPTPARAELSWLDVMKGVAIVWIALDHVAERLLGFPYIANPSRDWPPLAERVAQLRPLHGHGAWDPVLNLLRYVGWSGEQGVQLFLIASGFGLTWGLMNRYGRGSLPLADFYRRRLARLYPLWWAVHVLFALTALLVGWGLSLKDPAFYLSLAGFRATPHLLYYFSPAWWFVGLILQLYAVYPLLWEGLRRWGPLWLLAMTCIVGVAARAVGLAFFGGYLEAWQRGAVFITRLPEFVFGIGIAAWLHADPERTDRALRSAPCLLAAAGAYVLGTFLSLTLPGMAVAPLLLGAGVFVFLYAALAVSHPDRAAGGGVWAWVGRHSYALYLLHHPLILRLVPRGLERGLRRALIGTVAAALLTVVGALALEQVVRFSENLVRRSLRRLGAVMTIATFAAFGAACYALLIAGELVVRQVAPQEVPEAGWGERASLEPDSVFAWRLKPSRETRLRWESYDYRVTSNSLGFPGPEYPVAARPGTLRILVTGDAFTSAEGVDTDRSWPRLLESELASRSPGRPVQVQNFAITAYGPNQYLAVVRAFAPIYHPDLVLIGFFVNEYEDVMRDDDSFRKSIGFGLPPASGWRSVLRLGHLRTLMRLEVLEPLGEILRGRPRPQGYFLGNFAALERHGSDRGPAQRRVADCLGRIKATADSLGAKVVLVMIPAPVQVCPPNRLSYFPHPIDLSDSSRFDLDLPQRTTRRLADPLGITCLDLRPVLRKVPGSCGYQPHNMHWTAAGHRAVADYLAQVLVSGRYEKER